MEEHYNGLPLLFRDSAMGRGGEIPVLAMLPKYLVFTLLLTTRQGIKEGQWKAYC